MGGKQTDCIRDTGAAHKKKQGHLPLLFATAQTDQAAGSER